MEKYKKAFGVPEKERIELGKEVWKIAADEVYIIGVIGMGPASMGVRVFKTNMGNVPSRQYNSPDGKTPTISRPVTFFWKNRQRRRPGWSARVDANPGPAMLAYIGRRAVLAVFTVWAISVLSFVIIQLPPGDYVTSYIAQIRPRARGLGRGGGEPAHPVRARPADLGPVLQAG